MKKRMTALAVAAGIALGAFAATTADYVQDGLMEFWDGINNTGNGTHDPNAAVWKSLVPGGQDLTIDAGVWTDGNCLSNDALRAAYANKKVAYVTGEFAIRNDRPGYADPMFAFMAGQADEFRRYVVFSGSEVKFYDRLVNGSTTESGRIMSANNKTAGFHTYSAAVRGPIYLDGVSQTIAPNVNTGWGAGNGLYLGSSDNASRIFYGRYYSIRLYNRMLTADEAMRNSIVDSVRFQGVYPNGYRASPADGSLQQRFRVAAPAGGTVTVDGEPLATDFEEWSAFGTESTHALTATPAEGYMFLGWTGDTGNIIGGNSVTNSITATRSLAITLTPLFTAIPEPTMPTPVVEIDIASGTVSLDAWLADHPDVTIGTAGTIVKKGAGTLQVTNDVIGTFAGDIVIRQGRWFAGVRKGLGTMNGGDVWVSDGATLHIYTATTTEVDASSKQITRRVYIKGTGTDNRGALYASAGTNSETHWVFPRYITLLGDARIEGANHVNFVDMFVDMNRFTATLSPTGCDWQRLNSGCWSNGFIKAISQPILFNADRRDPIGGGGAENIIRYSGASGYRANTYATTSTSSQGRWTAIFENNARFYGPNVNGGGCGWTGPMILEGDTSFTAQNQWTRILFWGPISGPGNLGKATSTIMRNRITLANANNSFMGGIWLKEQVLEATTDGAIPANGGAVNSDKSTIYLSAEEEYHLPDLAISGTGSVYSVAGTTGAFKDVTKKGSSQFTWNTKVGAKSFTLGGGTLGFGANAVDDGVVKADFGRLTVTNASTVALGGNSWTCTNLTGAATLVDGSLTVNGPWTLDVAEMATLGGGTATVAFGPDTVLSLANPAGLNRATTYTIATSAADFAAPVPVDAAARALRWRVRLSADNRSQELFYSGGTTITIR